MLGDEVQAGEDAEMGEARLGSGSAGRDTATSTGTLWLDRMAKPNWIRIHEDLNMSTFALTLRYKF
jgi:hypothetical protein